MRAIDLFAGCGGLSLGFRQAGFQITRAVEFDPAIAETYRRNHPGTELIVDDIRNVDSSGALRPGEADIIIGGPPCQGFSMAGARIRRGFIDDPRNYLFKHYFNVVRSVRPRVFLMENVKGMMTMQGGRIFEEILGTFSDPELLEGAPYHLTHRVLRATDFGVPQKRERLVILGTLEPMPELDPLWEETAEEIRAECPAFFDAVTVRDAIGNMPPTTPGGEIGNPTPETAYQRYLASPGETIMNHTSTHHSALAVDRMRRVAAGENFTVLEERINSVHSGAYGRLIWDAPAPTVTTRFDTPAGGRFIHPEEDRTISPREAARLQSFPDGFTFYGPRTTICREIGNAVPPKMAYFLARLIKKLI